MDFDEEWVHLENQILNPSLDHLKVVKLRKASSLASRFVEEVKKLM